jgi:hypothetical protein
MDFSIKFDLKTTQVIKLKDETSYGVTPLSSIAGTVEITSPDTIKETLSGTLDTFESGGEIIFPFNVRPAADGQPQKGTYTFKYTNDFGGLTTLTKEFNFQYRPVVADVNVSFDAFTPELKITDNTAYSKAGYSVVLTRLLSSLAPALSGSPTISSSTSVLDLAYSGDYYDTEHQMSLSSTVVYTNSIYSWLTIEDIITWSEESSPNVPPDLDIIIGYITTFREAMDAFKGVNLTEYEQRKKDYSFMASILSHAAWRYRFGDTDNLDDYLQDIIDICNGYGFIMDSDTDEVIEPYDFSIFDGGAGSGDYKSSTLTYDADGTEGQNLAIASAFSSLANTDTIILLLREGVPFTETAGTPTVAARNFKRTTTQIQFAAELGPTERIIIQKRKA